jgi:hypothetical protein
MSTCVTVACPISCVNRRARVPLDVVGVAGQCERGAGKVGGHDLDRRVRLADNHEVRGYLVGADDRRRLARRRDGELAARTSSVLRRTSMVCPAASRTRGRLRAISRRQCAPFLYVCVHEEMSCNFKSSMLQSTT